MNQTKKNGKWKMKSGTICLPCSTGTDIIPVPGYSTGESGDHEFSILLCDQTITKRTLFCRA